MTARPAGGGGLTVMVRDIAEARAAIAVAADTGGPVRLLSPPGAAGTLGPEVFMAIVHQASADRPDVDVEAMLDCGDDPGFALAALRAGAAAVVVAAGEDVLARLSEIAAETGARVVPARAVPPAVDTAAPGANDCTKTAHSREK